MELTGAIKIVFSKPEYIGMAAVVFVAMFFILAYLSEFVFFEPYFVLYVPADRAVSFVTLVTVAAMSGLVIPLSVFRLILLNVQTRKIGGSFIGSLVGVSAGACSCGPVGFAIISTFGAAGGVATSFLTAYEIPLRLVSIAILGVVYYTASRSIRAECRIK
ncbi:MAG: hypothetical protein QXY22_02255 [Candidatus Nitrosotenuis sp.]